MDHLKNASTATIQQIQDLTCKLSDEQFSKPLDLFHGSSIGQHLRHIIEFYQCLFSAENMVDYDQRERNLELENNRKKALKTLSEIQNTLNKVAGDRSIALNSNFSMDPAHSCMVISSFYRELCYNLEHAVHHMAIIRMGVQHYWPEINLTGQFGVAHSTIRDSLRSSIKSA